LHQQHFGSVAGGSQGRRQARHSTADDAKVNFVGDVRKGHGFVAGMGRKDGKDMANLITLFTAKNAKSAQNTFVFCALF
jgi:hypothetical protein